MTIFHIIEWLRWTLLLTTALVAVNLLPLFYLLTVLNVPYGIIVCLIAIVTRYSEEGSKCALKGQETRSLYMALQIICLVMLVLTFPIHLIYMRIRGANWCHEQYTHEEEEEE